MTHDDGVLARLQHGPATASELYALGVIAHSRVASLRKKGHVITCARRPEGDGASAFIYTLEPVRLDGAAPVDLPDDSSYRRVETSLTGAVPSSLTGSRCREESEGMEGVLPRVAASCPPGRLISEPGLLVGQMQLVIA